MRPAFSFSTSKHLLDDKGDPMKNSACLCLAVMALIGFTTPSLAAEVRAAIEAANAKFSALAAQGDGATLAGLYAKDGAVMPAGSDPVRGTQAIAKFWQSAFASGVAVIELKTVEVYAQGATASEVGEYALRDKAGKLLDRGKYIVIWHNEGGQWKLLRDMFSTNVPPPKS
jgi:ketosteroid isomerase-like protein